MCRSAVNPCTTSNLPNCAACHISPRGKLLNFRTVQFFTICNEFTHVFRSSMPKVWRCFRADAFDCRRYGTPRARCAAGSRCAFRYRPSMQHMRNGLFLPRRNEFRVYHDGAAPTALALIHPQNPRNLNETRWGVRGAENRRHHAAGSCNAMDCIEHGARYGSCFHITSTHIDNFRVVGLACRDVGISALLPRASWPPHRRKRDKRAWRCRGARTRYPAR